MNNPATNVSPPPAPEGANNASATPAGSAKAASCTVSGIMWWTTLIVAVIAVPLVSGSVALAVSSNSMLQMLVFMITCWASVWMGMWLMRKADRK